MMSVNLPIHALDNPSLVKNATALLESISFSCGVIPLSLDYCKTRGYDEASKIIIIEERRTDANYESA